MPTSSTSEWLTRTPSCSSAATLISDERTPISAAWGEELESREVIGARFVWDSVAFEALAALRQLTTSRQVGPLHAVIIECSADGQAYLKAELVPPPTALGAATKRFEAAVGLFDRPSGVMIAGTADTRSGIPRVASVACRPASPLDLIASVVDRGATSMLVDVTGADCQTVEMELGRLGGQVHWCCGVDRNADTRIRSRRAGVLPTEPADGAGERPIIDSAQWPAGARVVRR